MKIIDRMTEWMEKHETATQIISAFVGTALAVLAATVLGLS